MPIRGSSNPRGLTLVEILVVISIIALLAATSAPPILGAKRRGQLTVSVANTKQMLAAVQLYGADFDDVFAFGLPRFWADKRALLPADLQTQGRLAPFIEDQLKLYGCAEQQFRAPADPGFAGSSAFERYRSSYSFRVRAFLEPKSMTFYPEPAGYPLVHEADWFYSEPGLGSKRLVGFIDGHARMSPWWMVADLMDERPMSSEVAAAVLIGN